MEKTCLPKGISHIGSGQFKNQPGTRAEHASRSASGFVLNETWHPYPQRVAAKRGAISSPVVTWLS
jgi:hypothetical protein